MYWLVSTSIRSLVETISCCSFKVSCAMDRSSVMSWFSRKRVQMWAK
jgi:hypothetical protein